ncbi:MAG: S41 family peptidase, partial [Planctomycetota bacterium]|nr:S41 family peptidase [Planctomycetota bacterium]
AIIDVPSVLGDHRKPDDHWDFMLDRDKKIGYIRISSFIQNTTQELKAALDELKQEGMKGLVLDLRDDPGGLLSAAVEVSDLFLEEGKIVSTKGRNSPERIFSAHKDGTYTDFPMVVMVNESTASAAEIVSAALQDHKRAAIVGQRSFGKGSVQNILDLEDGKSVLKLTIATYWRPSGKNIHRFKNAKESDEWGVSPDKGLEVKLTPKEHLDWALARQRRDMVAFGKKKPDAAAESPKKEAESKKDGPKKNTDQTSAQPATDKKSDDKKADASKEKKLVNPVRDHSPKPFKDLVLEKAVSVLNGKMTEAASSAKAK